jgi:hypothetical protein
MLSPVRRCAHASLLSRPSRLTHTRCLPGAGAPVSATFDAPEARPETSDAAGGDASAPSRTDAARAAQQEVMDALVAFIVACEQLQGGAHLQAVSYAVWLLRVLVEAEHAAGVPAEGAASAAVAPRACLVSEADAASLRAAASSAAAALTRHLREPWADAVVPLLCAQWPLARRVGETPCLGDEHVASLVFANAAASLTAAAEPAPSVVQPGPRSAAAATASAAERALVSVRRYLVLRGACAVLAGATLGAAPPLASLPEAFTLCSDEMREGATSPVGTPDGVPCRVAFERGKERRVLLTAAPCRIAPAPSSGPGDRSVAGVTTMLLLVEGSAAQPGAGAGAADGAAPAVPPQAAGSLVHAVAPAAGAEVRANVRPLGDVPRRHLPPMPPHLLTICHPCAAPPAAVQRHRAPQVAAPARAPVHHDAARLCCAAGRAWGPAVRARLGAAPSAQRGAPAPGRPLDARVRVRGAVPGRAAQRVRARAAAARGLLPSARAAGGVKSTHHSYSLLNTAQHAPSRAAQCNVAFRWVCRTTTSSRLG